MLVLAFLTDPDVVGKILRHLGLPTTAPSLARSRSCGQAMGFVLAEDEAASTFDLGEEAEESAVAQPPMRLPP